MTESNEEVDANANLIAAAPELLEACKAFWAWEFWSPHNDETRNDNELHDDCIDKMKAAIAKAEGK